MTVQTSYYANIPKLPKDSITVSISGALEDYVDLSLLDHWDRRMAPSWDIFKEYKSQPEGVTREELFVKRFKNEIIPKLNFKEIFDEYIEKFGDKTFILVCYETPKDFCHRQIIAEAIESELGITVKEYGVGDLERIGYKYRPKINKSLSDFFKIKGIKNEKNRK